MSLDADDTEKGVLQDVDMSRSIFTAKQPLVKPSAAHLTIIIIIIIATVMVAPVITAVEVYQPARKEGRAEGSN